MQKMRFSARVVRVSRGSLRSRSSLPAPPDRPWDAKAQRLLEEGRALEAVALLKQAAQMHKDGTSYSNLAVALERHMPATSPEEVLSLYALAARLEPDNPVILLNLAGALLRGGKHAEALASVRTALPLLPAASPERAEAQVLEARVLQASGKRAEAEAVLGRVVEEQPDMRSAWEDLAMVQAQAGSPQAEHTLAEVGARFGEAQELQLRAYLSSAAGRWEEARTVLLRLVALAPDHTALLNLAATEERLGNIPAAKELAQRAAAEVGDDANVQRFLASLLIKDGDMAGAEALLRSLIDTNPLDSVNYMLLGQALTLAGRGHEALALYDRTARKVKEVDAKLAQHLERLATLHRQHYGEANK